VVQLLILPLLACLAGPPFVGGAEDKPPVKAPASPPKLGEADARKVQELQKQVDKLWYHAQFAEALKPAEEVVQIRTRVQGAKHWETADARRFAETLRLIAGKGVEDQPTIARLPEIEEKATDLYRKGRYREAQALFEQVLTGHQKVLGEEHPRTAGSYNNLATTLNDLGRYAEAHKLNEKALAIRRKTLGDDHPDTAESYNGLGVDLEMLGQHSEARQLLERALAIRRTQLGEEHPQTGESYNNVAYTLSAQGRYAEAQQLFEKALAIDRKMKGEEHPDTALKYNNVAFTLGKQGRHAEAQALNEKALAIFRKVLGEEHPSTALSYHNVAGDLNAQGRAAEAQPLYDKALAIFRRTLGANHPRTAICCDSAATNLNALDRFAEAQPLVFEALAIKRKVLGEEHPDTAMSNSNVAANLYLQARYDEAQPHLEKALAIFRKRLGDEHPDTAEASNNLAMNLAAQGRYAEAQPLAEKALALLRQTLGEQHPYTAQSYRNLSIILRMQGRYSDAAQALRAAERTLETNRLLAGTTGLERAGFAAEHSDFAALTTCLARMGNFAEAWTNLEANLARGLLDDFSARLTLARAPKEQRQQQELTSRLQHVDEQLAALLNTGKSFAAVRSNFTELSQQRTAIQTELGEFAASLAARELYHLERVQKALPPDTALLAWVDARARGKSAAANETWACLVRHQGAPVFVPLSGSGQGNAWTKEDDDLPHQVATLLTGGPTSLGEKEQALFRRLYDQRLKRLEQHLQARDALPAVGHLVILPGGVMTGMAVEALTDRYTISYAPSATIFAQLREQRQRSQRRLQSAPQLLAIGDPGLRPPELVRAPSAVPTHGVLLTQIMPGSNAATHGLKTCDVLQEYGGTRLAGQADLRKALQAQSQKAPPETTRGDSGIPVKVWRNGKTVELAVAAGPLGVYSDPHPAAEAMRLHREADDLLRRSRGPQLEPLPFARHEVRAIAALFPRSTVLLGSQARADRLEEMAARDELRQYRYLHFATHGLLNDRIALQSALVMAQDNLPDSAAQVLAGRKALDGQVTAARISTDWKLDADLVVLSACHSARGKPAGGEGFLGFSQALLLAGARSLVLSQWQVDDKATALLMKRFYENLLGARPDQRKPLPKAKALREAKAWLRAVTTDQAEAALRQLAADGAVAKGSAERGQPVEKKGAPLAGHPYAHPYYWAAFVLVGDPD
jgi:tetratricopeptide (TPR) repeat protein